MEIKSHGNQIPWESNLLRVFFFIPMGIKSLGNQFPWKSNPLVIFFLPIGNLINIQRKQKDTSVTNYEKLNATNNKAHNLKYSRLT